MGRYFIHLAYNGANFNGWQTQPGLPTVQQAVEDALSVLLRRRVGVVGCGRTDTGVHASDFYAHFDAEGEMDAGQLTFKMNNLLPQDVVVFGIERVADSAHARFDAVSRTYQYHVSDLKLPFRQGQYCRIFYKPDLELMNRAAEVLMEYDDFTSFAKLHTQVKTNICHLSMCRWDLVQPGVGDITASDSTPQAPSAQTGYEWVLTIRSNRFLRNMVRSVTGTLLDVGRGKLSIDGLREIVERKDRSAAGVSMPACGLFLTKVEYPHRSGVDNADTVTPNPQTINNL